jgi:hypothetical protein
MKIFGHPQLVLVASLLIAAPALAQTPQTQTQAPPAATQALQARKPHTQDSKRPTAVAPVSGAYKQPAQGELPEVGPASGAYNGNTQHSRY